MNSIVKIPKHTIDNKSFYSRPEWPGILPCRFHNSKRQLNPPSHSIFQMHHNISNDSLFRPQKRTIILPPGKEAEFRPSSKYVPPPSNQRNPTPQIYPQGSYAFRGDEPPIRLKEHKFYYVQETKNKILTDMRNKHRNGEIEDSTIGSKTHKLLKKNPVINQLYKSLSDHDLLFQYDLKRCNDEPRKRHRILDKSISIILKNPQYFIKDESNEQNIKFPPLKK